MFIIITSNNFYVYWNLIRACLVVRWVVVEQGDLEESNHFQLFFIMFVSMFGSFPNGIPFTKLILAGSNSMLLLQWSSHIYRLKNTSHIKLLNINHFISILILIKINYKKINSTNTKPNTHLVIILHRFFGATPLSFTIPCFCSWKPCKYDK